MPTYKQKKCILSVFVLSLLEFLKINFKYIFNHLKDDNAIRIKGGGAILSETSKHQEGGDLVPVTTLLGTCFMHTQAVK